MSKKKLKAGDDVYLQGFFSFRRVKIDKVILKASGRLEGYLIKSRTGDDFFLMEENIYTKEEALAMTLKAKI